MALYPIKNKNVNGTLIPVTQALAISSPYGPRNGSFHNGIDIPIPVGSELQAPIDGLLTYNVNEKGGNQVIVVSEDSKTRFGFAHLLNLNIAEKIGKGTKIKKGTVVGLSGNTGRSTGPHLHLTCTNEGQLVNPNTVNFTFDGNTGPYDNGPLRLPLPQLPSVAVILILLLILVVILFIKSERGQEFKGLTAKNIIS